MSANKAAVMAALQQGFASRKKLRGQKQPTSLHEDSAWKEIEQVVRAAKPGGSANPFTEIAANLQSALQGLEAVEGREADMDAALPQLRKLLSQCKLAARGRGRPRAEQLEFLIERLIPIYKRHTGSECGTGPFARFVSAVADANSTPVKMNTVADKIKQMRGMAKKGVESRGEEAEWFINRPEGDFSRFAHINAAVRAANARTQKRRKQSA